MIYLIYCKDICKCHNVPPPSTTIKKKKFSIKKCPTHERAGGEVQVVEHLSATERPLIQTPVPPAKKKGMFIL
jgi:hypothetical protein